MTNIDSIKRFDEKEMSKFLYSVYLSCCICCNRRGRCTPSDNCREKIQEWLSTEIDHPEDHVKEIPLEELDLTPRVYESLHQARIHTVGELEHYTAYDLAKIPHLGEKSISEIVQKIKSNTGTDLKI